MARRFRLIVILVFALQVIGTSAQAPAPPPAPNPNAVSAVEFVIDPPTLLNLGFEWFIQGDDNRNATVTVSYKAEDFDFRLKPGSAAVDKGTPLPNVTEGFSGKAPDLGALEVGGTVPRYGPRQ